jgi:hypothetical protein
MPEAVARRFPRFEPLMMRIPIDQIGGGRVVRQYRGSDGQIVKVGTTLTGDQIRNMGAANRRELMDRYISVWPQAPAAVASPPGAAEPTERSTTEPPSRFVVPLGFGAWDVVEGIKLNDKAVTRAEAYALAGKPLPPSKKDEAH